MLNSLVDEVKLQPPPGLLRATQLPFADSVDQDQTAQNVQSDLGSTLSDMEMDLPKYQLRSNRMGVLILSV